MNNHRKIYFNIDKDASMGIRTIAPEENRPRLGLGFGLGLVLGLVAIFLRGNCPRTASTD